MPYKHEILDMVDGPGEQPLRWCNRCRASVPISEWSYSPIPGIMTHEGMARDIIDAPVRCGYSERVPVRRGS